MKNHIALQAQSSQQAHSRSLKVYAKIGYGSAGTTVNNCTNYGDVKSTALSYGKVGGIVGAAKGFHCMIADGRKDCYNHKKT